MTDHAPIIVIAVGQCGVTVAHQLFHQFKCPHLHPSFFAQVPPTTTTQRPTAIPTAPFHQLSPSERDARIRRTLETMTSIVHGNPVLGLGQWIPRCVLLDTEPKVITHVVNEGGPVHELTHKRAWRYHPKCVQWRSAGAANNWGYGYNVHGSDMYKAISRGLRAQVKLAYGTSTSTAVPSFLVLHSVAGGTGSGVGTYVTEKLRQDYPRAAIINQTVWPFSRGEVVCQHYNIILTIAHLRHVSNLILILWNDHLHRICSDRLAIKSPGLSDLNRVIAHTLAQILTTPCSLAQLTGHLKPKLYPPLATVYHVPQVRQASVAFTTLSWTSMVRSLRQMLLTHSPIDELLDWTCIPGAFCANSVESLAVILRGVESSKVDTAAFRDPGLYINSVPNVSVTAAPSSGIKGLDKWAAIVCTSSAVCRHLSMSLQSAVSMFHCGAYLHQYEKFGVTRDDFIDAISNVWQMLQMYDIKA